jgi:hypothetical protein
VYVTTGTLLFWITVRTLQAYHSLVRSNHADLTVLPHVVPNYVRVSQSIARVDWYGGFQQGLGIAIGDSPLVFGRMALSISPTAYYLEIPQVNPILFLRLQKFSSSRFRPFNLSLP